jgi:hypothetical protein
MVECLVAKELEGKYKEAIITLDAEGQLFAPVNTEKRSEAFS